MLHGINGPEVMLFFPMRAYHPKRVIVNVIIGDLETILWRHLKMNGTLARPTMSSTYSIWRVAERFAVT